MPGVRKFLSMVNKRESEFKYFFLSILLKGKNDWINYQIIEEHWIKTREFISDIKKYNSFNSLYLQFLTSHRNRILVNIKSICALRFLWEPIKNFTPEVESNQSETIIHFEHPCQKISFLQDDPETLYSFYVELNGYSKNDNFLIGILDEDSEEIFFNPQHVNIIEMPEDILNKFELST